MSILGVQRLYRMICEGGHREIADLFREIFPDYGLQPYDAERRIIAAYKNERAA